jgi:hypothetical protein
MLTFEVKGHFAIKIDHFSFIHSLRNIWSFTDKVITLFKKVGKEMKRELQDKSFHSLPLHKPTVL